MAARKSSRVNSKYTTKYRVTNPTFHSRWAYDTLRKGGRYY